MRCEMAQWRCKRVRSSAVLRLTTSPRQGLAVRWRAGSGVGAGRRAAGRVQFLGPAAWSQRWAESFRSLGGLGCFLGLLRSVFGQARVRRVFDGGASEAGFWGSGGCQNRCDKRMTDVWQAYDKRMAEKVAALRAR